MTHYSYNLPFILLYKSIKKSKDVIQYIPFYFSETDRYQCSYAHTCFYKGLANNILLKRDRRKTIHTLQFRVKSNM